MPRAVALSSAPALAICLLLATGTGASAQVQGGGGAPRAAQPVGRASDIIVTARRIDKAIDIDGRLDDEVYQRIPAITEFIQQEPQEGAATSERTEAWVMFDDTNLYVSGKCFDSHPEREVLTELRRDNVNIFQNDSFTIVIDTFNDLRNGYMFQTNALGAIRDQAIVDQATNDSWNTIWEVRTARYEWGWTVEMSIPFKSLRYTGAGPQVWGINLRRVIKWKNEYAYITHMPAAFGPNGAISRMGEAATLNGVETPKQSMNLELKPYAVSSMTTDKTAKIPIENDGTANAGFDFKYGLTRGLILDATVNTDFAQVEEDQQQVNLTRFSLFFPEKRDFFLEGQGVFAFGGVSSGNNGNPGEVPIMFFSRRIGLSGSQTVPVMAGARTTGRSGKFQIGALNIETGDKPEAGAVRTNFTAVRIKRDILRRSNVGIVATNRSPATSTLGHNLLLGADANLFLFRDVTANAYYARTDSSLQTAAGESSYRGRFAYSSDRWGYAGEHLLIGPRFNPEVGYVKRLDFRRSYGEFRFSPRPKDNRRVRKYTFQSSLDYITNAAVTEVQEKELRQQFITDYQSGNQLTFDYTRNYELLPRGFVINPGTVVPQGGYDYQNLRVQYSLGQQRRKSGQISAAYGSLYGGTKTEAGFAGRLGFVPQFVIEPTISLNWVRLPVPNGDFEAPVVSSRFIFTPSARTALTAFIQYNGSSRLVSSSYRLRWEYRPGSELFAVYSDGRNTLTPGFPDMLNRTFALKVTRLLRF